MVSDNTECILQKLNIQHTGIKLNELARSVRKKLCHSFFFNYWNKKSKEPEGKVDNYFKIKKCFSRETYLSINNFRLRRALCQIRTRYDYNLMIMESPKLATDNRFKK